MASRPRSALVVVGLLSALVMFATGACGEDYKDCYGEDLISCTCAGGAVGYAKCGPSGDFKSSPCICDGATPGIDAGHDSGSNGGANDATSDAPSDAALVCTREAGADAAGAKRDFETCATADECDGCRCELFQNQHLCTRACTGDADCPGTGCNPRGICRNPP